MSGTPTRDDSPPAPAVPYGDVSRLCGEAALRLREGRRPEDIADALPAIERARAAIEPYFKPPAPLEWASYPRSATNADLFDALNKDYPGEDWQRVFGLQAGDPDQAGHMPYLVWGQATSGRKECLFDDGARHELAVCLDRWARFFAEKQREADEAGRRMQAILALVEGQQVSAPAAIREDSLEPTRQAPPDLLADVNLSAGLSQSCTPEQLRSLAQKLLERAQVFLTQVELGRLPANAGPDPCQLRETGLRLLRDLGEDCDRLQAALPAFDQLLTAGRRREGREALTVDGKPYCHAFAAALGVVLAVYGRIRQALLDKEVWAADAGGFVAFHSHAAGFDDQFVGRHFLAMCRRFCGGDLDQQVQLLRVEVDGEYASLLRAAAPAAGTGQPQPTAEKQEKTNQSPADPPDKSSPPRKGKRINERMLVEMKNNPTASLDRSLREWADLLECSPSTVQGTAAWTELENLREGMRLAKQIKNKDKRSQK
jgi:hypothetical protein